jgi:hypothetical protein
MVTVLPRPQYRDDFRDGGGRGVRRDHGQDALVRRGRLQGIEL